MNTYTKIQFLFLLTSLTLLTACKQSIFSGKIDEGTIVYEISYLDDEEDNPLISLLPKEMTIKFKNNSSISYIEGFFGTFKLVYLTDYKTATNSTILKVMDKKYIYSVDTAQLPAGYAEMENIELQKTEQRIEILGYDCKVAKFVCPAISDQELYVYYTDEIAIKSPNTNNPFRELDGVLMGFQVKLTGINMKFIAKEVIEEKIEDTEFELPEGYKQVSKKELEDILQSFQSN